MANRAIRTALILLFPMTLGSMAARAEERAGAVFSFRGQPIAPQCLEPFSVGGAEAPPSVKQVDLASCAGTSDAGAVWEAGAGGSRSFRRSSDGGGAGAFGYVHRGRTSDGLDVLQTWDNGGGSGTYTAVLLVRREGSHLFLAGAIPGGDRCVAGIDGVTVLGRDVSVDFRLGAADLLGLAGDLASTELDGTHELDLGAGTPSDCEGAVRYRYAPATGTRRHLLGVDYRPSDRVLRGESLEPRCLREAFGVEARFLGRPELRRAAQRLQSCLAAGAVD